MKSGEIKITLPAADLERMKQGGRVSIDVERPPEAVGVFRADLDQEGMPVRVAPQSEKNGFRRHRPCADCGNFARRHNQFSCKAKTFKGESYMLFAVSCTCDKWKPKLKVTGGKRHAAEISA
ncbi:hypothetical protein [Pontiella sp.]|uniref:hypothetical protein n=1 Tax=Pontiella sp. TaxID=2837462 RepID=UPI003563999C